MTTQAQQPPLELSVDDLPAELQSALANFLISLADNKQFLGMRYAEWCDGAPTLEAGVAAAGMAQDELGHARSLHTVLRSFPQVPPEVYEKETERDEYWQISFLAHSLDRWADLIAVNFLFDSALTVLFEAATDSRLAGLRQRARKIVEEERFHHMYSRAWFQRLAKAAPQSQAALQEAVDRIWTEALCWYGPANGDLSRFYAYGLFDGDGEALRQRFLNRVMSVLQDVEIHPPVGFRLEDNVWVPASSLPWGNWDPEKRQLE